MGVCMTAAPDHKLHAGDSINGLDPAAYLTLGHEKMLPADAVQSLITKGYVVLDNVGAFHPAPCQRRRLSGS